MNDFYFDLPDVFKSFLKNHDDIENQIPNFSGHGWLFKPTNDFFNDQCFDYFKERNLELTNETKIFSCPPNCLGSIHSDAPTEFAFNFIIKGHGEMQWLEVKEKGIIVHHQVVTGQKSQYRKFVDIDNIKILEVWKNNLGLVKVNNVHRIVTFDQRRICISLRLKPRYRNIKFKDMIELIK